MTTVQKRLGQIRGEMQAAVELGNAVWLDDLRREQYALWQREQDDAHDRDAVGQQERRIVVAAMQYRAATDALDTYRRAGEVLPGQTDAFLRRIGELASAKQNARDALLDLARATPDAEEHEG